jgi:hypothetical protein
MVDFLGIGVPRAGTTWLYHHLVRHPQIAFPGGKEVHFWDRADVGGAALWLDRLEPPERATPSGQPIRSGEITPTYARLPEERIAAIRALCPDLRLFVSFRNPLERAYSEAMADLARSGRPVAEVPDQWFVDHFRSEVSRADGDYLSILDRWGAAFSDEQLFSFISDEIEACPVGMLEALADHLQVDPSGFGPLSPADLAERIVPRSAEGAAAGQVQDLLPRPSLVPVLQEIYAVSVEQFGRRLGRDLKRWVGGFGTPRVGGPLPRREIALN